MTSSRLLARNTVINFVGQLVPVPLAILAIPILLARIGETRFGVLSLASAAIGYFSIFDLGLGRALTHAVATRLGRDESEQELGPLCWTATFALIGLGIIGGLALALATPLLVNDILGIDASLRVESRAAFYILAAALPATLATAGLRGVLEAHQHFGIVNILRAPLAAFNFIGPLLVLPFSVRVDIIVAVLAAGRVVGCLLHFHACWTRYPFFARVAWNAAFLRPLLLIGGWITVSNVISPLMVNLDRFVIGAVLPVAWVAYYVTPFELVTKLWLIPAALLGVIFPAISAAFERDPDGGIRLLDRSIRFIMAAVFPPVVVLVAFAPEILALWINPDFARRAAPVMQILGIGLLANSVGQAAHTALVAGKRARWAALLHVAELPAYAALAWVAVGRWGITGIAAAWTVRVTIDALLMSYGASGMAPVSRDALRQSVTVLLVLCAALVGLTMVEPLAWRAAGATVGLLAFGVLLWTRLLSGAERDGFMALIRRRETSLSGLTS